MNISEFQLTLPRRERYDTFGTSRHITNLRFNSRSHVGSDYIVKLLYKEVRSFNSCSHVGSNDKSNHKICEPKSFQLTLPRREQYYGFVANPKAIMFQFTLHGGSDGGADSGYTKNAVSIHAPMEGAIEMDSHFNSHTPVSTHAPT